MKKTIKVFEKNKYVEKEVNYIPFRYIVAMLLTIFEIVSIIAIMVILAIYVPYFYIAIMVTVVGVVIQIIGSNENPDYKVPWLLFVITLPIVGLMLYFIFHQRKLPRKYFKRLNKMKNPIILNEVQFYNLIKESVSRIIKEGVNNGNIRRITLLL